MTTPSTPQSAARSTSLLVHRAKAKTFGPSFRFTISCTAFSSEGEMAGIPASMRWTPTSASFSAIASLSSQVKTTPACCSPSRRVTPWSWSLSEKCSSFLTSGAKFQGLVNQRSVFHIRTTSFPPICLSDNLIIR